VCRSPGACSLEHTRSACSLPELPVPSAPCTDAPTQLRRAAGALPWASRCAQSVSSRLNTGLQVVTCSRANTTSPMPTTMQVRLPAGPSPSKRSRMSCTPAGHRGRRGVVCPPGPGIDEAAAVLHVHLGPSHQPAPVHPAGRQARPGRRCCALTSLIYNGSHHKQQGVQEGGGWQGRGCLRRRGEAIGHRRPCVHVVAGLRGRGRVRLRHRPLQRLYNTCVHGLLPGAGRGRVWPRFQAPAGRGRPRRPGVQHHGLPAAGRSACAPRAGRWQCTHSPGSPFSLHAAGKVRCRSGVCATVLHTPAIASPGDRGGHTRREGAGPPAWQLPAHPARAVSLFSTRVLSCRLRGARARHHRRSDPRRLA